MSAPTSQHDEIFEEWCSWLPRIEDDVYRLHVDRRVWKDTIEMLERNEDIPNKEFFKGWLTQQHMEAMSMGIRRQTEVSDVYAVATLLDAIRRNPAVLSRQRFAELCGPESGQYWKDIVDNNYDEWSGSGKDTIDPEIVAQRIKQLEDVSESIRTYVDKMLAHADRGEPPTGVTFGEFDSALDGIGEVLTDLYLLLTCKSLASPEPVIQSPWRRAFSVPWLPQEEVDRERNVRDVVSRRRRQ